MCKAPLRTKYRREQYKASGDLDKGIRAAASAITALAGGDPLKALAQGAATGELAARAIKDYLYPDTDIAHLSNGDKDKISNLASLAAMLAGSVASDSSAGAVSGHDAGKNAVDNNALGADAGTALGFWFGKSPDCDTDCKAKVVKETAEGNAVVSAGIANTAGVAALSGPLAAGIRNSIPTY
ncbi:VENN motif pre-toxin domain-containing protein [Pectobacterium sp. LFLA-215]|uniref:VENN motif pre-toxin domain-containing protein n=1 Tax=Pectobacterium sp. LFLA-215 TaxID=3419008 RepID=UPI003F5C897E